MPKFTQMYNIMIKENKELFESFKAIHDEYKIAPQQHSVEFNTIGKEVLEVIREYEDRLCSGMERGVFGKYSNKVSEKFWDRIKKDFSHVEMIGVEISNT